MILVNMKLVGLF